MPPACTAVPRSRSLATRVACLALCAAAVMTICLVYVFTSATALHATAADAQRSGDGVKAAAAKLGVLSNLPVDHNNHSGARGLTMGPLTVGPPTLKSLLDPGNVKLLSSMMHHQPSGTYSVTSSPSRLNHSEQYVKDGAVPAIWHRYSYTKVSGRVIPGTADVMAVRYRWTHARCQAACDRTEACNSYMYSRGVQPKWSPFWQSQCELWSRAYGMRLSDWHAGVRLDIMRYALYFKDRGELAVCKAVTRTTQT